MPKKNSAAFNCNLKDLPVDITPERVKQLLEIQAGVYYERVAILQALADDRRLRLLDALENGELCACMMVDLLYLKPSALSYHLSLLTDAGLIRSRRDGSFQVYALTEEGKSVLNLLRGLG